MKKNCFKNIFSYCLFILLSLLGTYPLFLRIKDHIPGFHSTDEPYAALWNFWWLKYAWKKGLPSYDYNTVAVPFGINYIKLSVYPVWEFINKWLTILTNNFIAYNLETMISFFLAALFMYYLVSFLTGDKLSAVLAGIIYAFCPYHFVRAWQHLGLAQIQWMPLYLLSLFILAKNMKLKNVILSAFCFYLVLSFDLYYACFMFIVTIFFILFLLLYSKGKKVYCLRALKMFSLMAVLILLISSPNLYALYKGTMSIKAAGVKAEYGYIRPFQDLFTQSARPLSYFLPASTHPFFGKFTDQFLGSQLYGVSFTEHTLYLGWVPIILAFYAFKKWRKDRKLSAPSCELQITDNYNFYRVFFILLTIIAWFFSQPPWWEIGPVKIYMPSFFIYKIMPSIRAYCRYGIVVMLAIAVLAGFGLRFILERFKTQSIKVAIAALFCILVLFEFWNYPPFKVIDFSKTPAVYTWLKSQPDNLIIAEYPIDIDGANVLYMFYQTRHEKKIINCTIPGTYANRVNRTITKLSEPHAAGILRWMGVKYALVHREGYLNTELTQDKEELNKISDNSGLKLIQSFMSEECPREDIMCVRKTGQIDVYEVIALAINPE